MSFDLPRITFWSFCFFLIHSFLRINFLPPLLFSRPRTPHISYIKPYFSAPQNSIIIQALPPVRPISFVHPRFFSSSLSFLLFHFHFLSESVSISPSLCGLLVFDIFPFVLYCCCSFSLFFPLLQSGNLPTSVLLSTPKSRLSIVPSVITRSHDEDTSSSPPSDASLAHIPPSLPDLASAIKGRWGGGYAIPVWWGYRSVNLRGSS